MRLKRVPNTKELTSNYYYLMHTQTLGKESTCNAGDSRDSGLIPGSGRFSWSRKYWQYWQPKPVFVSGKFHGQRSLVGYSRFSLVIYFNRDTCQSQSLNSFHPLPPLTRFVFYICDSCFSLQINSSVPLLLDST